MGTRCPLLFRIYSARRCSYAPPRGSPLANAEDAVAVLGEALGHGAKLVAIPAARLHPEFFRLRSGIAGAFLQKFVTYGVRVAILGDLREQIKASTALRDFVIESNRGEAIWFPADLQELEKRLALAAASR